MTNQTQGSHDAAHREAIKAVIRAELNLVGLAMRAARRVVDTRSSKG